MKIVILTKKKEEAIKNIIKETKDRSLVTKYLKYGVCNEIDSLIHRIESALNLKKKYRWYENE